VKRTELRNRIAWVRKSEPSFRRNFGRRSLFLVTYDANTVSRSRAAQIAYFIFGRVVRRRNNGMLVEYTYTGFIHRPGVLWVGQSVLLVTREREAELDRYLRHEGVAHHSMAISIG